MSEPKSPIEKGISRLIDAVYYITVKTGKNVAVDKAVENIVPKPVESQKASWGLFPSNDAPEMEVVQKPKGIDFWSLFPKEENVPVAEPVVSEPVKVVPVVKEPVKEPVEERVVVQEPVVVKEKKALVAAKEPIVAKETEKEKKPASWTDSLFVDEEASLILPNIFASDDETSTEPAPEHVAKPLKTTDSIKSQNEDGLWSKLFADTNQDKQKVEKQVGWTNGLFVDEDLNSISESFTTMFTVNEATVPTEQTVEKRASLDLSGFFHVISEMFADSGEEKEEKMDYGGLLSTYMQNLFPEGESVEESSFFAFPDIFPRDEEVEDADELKKPDEKVKPVPVKKAVAKAKPNTKVKPIATQEKQGESESEEEWASVFAFPDIFPRDEEVEDADELKKPDEKVKPVPVKKAVATPKTVAKVKTQPQEQKQETNESQSKLKAKIQTFLHFESVPLLNKNSKSDYEKKLKARLNTLVQVYLKLGASKDPSLLAVKDNLLSIMLEQPYDSFEEHPCLRDFKVNQYAKGNEKKVDKVMEELKVKKETMNLGKQNVKKDNPKISRDTPKVSPFVQSVVDGIQSMFDTQAKVEKKPPVPLRDSMLAHTLSTKSKTLFSKFKKILKD